MLFFLLQRLTATWPDSLATFEKITFRAAACALLSFLVALLTGPRLIAWLGQRFREPIKGDSARLIELHRHKQATPTMGGLFLIAGLVGGALAMGDLANPCLIAALVLTVGLTALGVADDLTKLFGVSNGLRARSKLLGQIAVAAAAATLVWRHHAALPGGLELHIPLWPQASLPLDAWFVPLAVVVIVGSSNAVNLTDGLDGLAGGCLIFATGAMAVLAYVSGHAELAAYLGVPRIAGAGEMTVLAGGMIGGLLGFLWFNCHPAQVFMGDTGSLPLGGLLGFMAVVTRQEALLVVIGGVFVAEAASVILQVGYFKWRRRRIFRCAPLHHHFQFQGWPEPRIVVRFWIAAALCALLGVATLKLNVREPSAACGFALTSAAAVGPAEVPAP
jgi:phospho-N-acetylmuramoyl-pentapeptide-transferase